MTGWSIKHYLLFASTLVFLFSISPTVFAAEEAQNLFFTEEALKKLEKTGGSVKKALDQKINPPVLKKSRLPSRPAPVFPKEKLKAAAAMALSDVSNVAVRAEAALEKVRVRLVPPRPRPPPALPPPETLGKAPGFFSEGSGYEMTALSLGSIRDSLTSLKGRIDAAAKEGVTAREEPMEAEVDRAPPEFDEEKFKATASAFSAEAFDIAEKLFQEAKNKIDSLRAEAEIAPPQPPPDFFSPEFSEKKEFTLPEFRELEMAALSLESVRESVASWRAGFRKNDFPEEPPPEEPPDAPAPAVEKPAPPTFTESAQNVFQKIIEQVIIEAPAKNPVVLENGVSLQTLALSLSELENKLKSEIYRVGAQRTQAVSIPSFPLSNRIDFLSKVTISDATITSSSFAGSVSGTTGTFSGSLTAAGGFFQDGLGDCAGSNNTVIYTLATGKFGCDPDAGGGSGSPGGSTGMVQFNNGGNFEGNNSLFVNIASGRVGVSTTSPYAALSVATSTRPQLLLSDPAAAADLKHWYASSTGGSLVFGTLSDSLGTLAARITISASGLTTVPGGFMANSSTSTITNLTTTLSTSTQATTTYLAVTSIASTSALVISGQAAASGNNCLQIDTAGTVTKTGSACGAGGGGGTPGGASTNVQFNNAGAFDGNSGFIYEFATGRVGLSTTTPYAALSVATSTRPQLLLTDPTGGVDLKHFYASSTQGSFVIGTVNDALSTLTPRFTIDSSGNANLPGTLTLGTLNGPLDARNGVISATTSVTHLYGGTGLTATPTFGQILRGTGSGYALVATSTLGIAISDTTGTLAGTRGGTGLSSITLNQLLVGAAGNTWTQIATSSLGLTTTNVAEGTNLYYTDARVQSFVHASTTIPKTYTTNTFTGANTFSGTFTLSGLSGPLDARNGVVGATTSITHLYGGTGLTATPSFGQILRGTGSGYALVATSTLGIAISDTTGTLSVTRGGTGVIAVADGALLFGGVGGGSANLSTLATTSGAGRFLSQDYSTGRPSWVATSSLGLTTTNVAEGTNLYYTDARVQSFVHASTTIPKTYTANTFTGASTFSGTFTLSGLNGPLDARNGVVGATTSITHLYGGTGLTAAPTFGQILRGTGSGYALVATSTLGIALADTTGTLPINRGGTNATTQATNGVNFFDGTSVTSGTGFTFDGTKAGIGSTSPSALLSVHANSGATNRLLLAIASSTASATTTLFSVDNTGLATFGDASGTGDASIQFASDTNAWSLGYFATDKTFRIASSTNLSANVLFQIGKSGTTTLSSGLGTGTGGNYLCIDTATFEILRGAGVACTASSIRFKENVQELSYGLRDVMKLHPVTFTYRPEMNSGTSTHLGFIAEEVALVVPELVSYNNNGEIQGLDYPVVTALLAKAVQELNLNLESIASAPASSTPESFAARFFSRMREWLASATNDIGDFFANRVRTKELCVRDETGAETCITKSELDSLLTSQSVSAAASPSSTESLSTPADTEPPVITLSGNNPATINVGETYGDLGAIVTDNSSNNLGYTVSLDGGPAIDPSQLSLDTSVPGPHTILFSATDAAGNTGTATRTVNVVDPNAAPATIGDATASTTDTTATSTTP